MNIIDTTKEQLEKELAEMRQRIAELETVEEALEESKEKYRKLFNNSVDAVCIFDVETRKILDVNDAYLKLYGYTRDEVLQLTTDDISAEPEETKKAIKKSSATGDVLIPARNHRKKDGTVFQVELSAGPYKWKGRNVMFAIARDITLRKRAEDKLKETNKKLQTLIQAIPDVVYFKDAQFRHLEVNKAFEEFLGIKREDILGKTNKELYPPFLFEHCQKADEELLRSGKIIDHLEERFKLENGKNIFLETTKVPLYDDQGTPKGLVGLTRDITGRKRAEEERQRLNAQLKQKNEELERIIYVTSHDLRTPLLNIDGYSKEIGKFLKELNHIFKSDGISGEVKEKIDVIIREEIPQAEHYITASVSKMDALLTGLLQISRLGRFEMNKEEIDMNKLVSDILDTSKYQVENAGVKIEISELPSCTGDKAQLNQLFSNMLGNALKYLDPGRPGKIKVSGRTENNRSVYCVEDNGIGISPDHHEKIFDIFYQLKPKQSSGEGLGLTIVKKIVDMHHGQIWVESEPGTGSKFYVSVPNR